MRQSAFLILVIAVAACAPFPEVDAMGAEADPPPQLLPIDDILAQAGTVTVDPGPALAARAAALKARAALIAAEPPRP